MPSTNERLSSVAPDLAELLASAPRDRLRAIAFRAAAWAVATVEPRGPALSAALGLLAEGQVGTSPGRSAL